MISKSYLMKSSERKAQQKFFAAVEDPAAIYAAFAIAKLPDSSIGDGLFQSLQRVLAKRGQTLVDWVQEQDPGGRYAQPAFFQLSEMGLLTPVLRGDPRLAQGVGRAIFSSPAAADPGRLGVFMDSVMKRWPASARQELLKGLVERDSSDPGHKILLASLADFYASQWTPEEKLLIQRVVPDSRFERSPALARASRVLKGIVAFHHYGQYSDFLLTAQKRGYQVVSTGKARV